MTATPMQVLTRPFAIEPVTNIMLPDGIFDNAIFDQRICCHYTNMTSTPLKNVRIWLESVGDPGVVPVARTWVFSVVHAGASVRISWDADFQNATPGKALVSFVAQADEFETRRSIQQIFISQTRFDPTSNTYTCTVEEGTLTVSNVTAIGPSAEAWWRCDLKEPRCPPTIFGPYVPTGVTMAWTPNPAYAGVHGDLPFTDPVWWKVIAVLVLVVALIVGAIAAENGGGRVYFSGGVKFDESGPSITHCCTTQLEASTKPSFTVAGAASAIAAGALIVACTDAADPFWRGQEATPPEAAELTLGERVEARWNLPEPPNAGKAYSADVEWNYQRTTNARTLSHSVNETVVNIHTAGEVTVETPDKVTAFAPLTHGGNALWVRVRFERSDGGLFKGTDLYAFALFQAPQGLIFVVDLTDDGIGHDPGPNDGVYAGSLNVTHAYRLLLAENQVMHGVWRVFVFAQDVNHALPGMPPHIAAQHIGGMFVASAVEITFDPSLPCPLSAQAAITVV